MTKQKKIHRQYQYQSKIDCKNTNIFDLHCVFAHLMYLKITGHTLWSLLFRVVNNNLWTKSQRQTGRFEFFLFKYRRCAHFMWIPNAWFLGTMSFTSYVPNISRLEMNSAFIISYLHIWRRRWFQYANACCVLVFLVTAIERLVFAMYRIQLRSQLKSKTFAPNLKILSMFGLFLWNK